MDFIGWMYDVAREQHPDDALLLELVQRSAAAGYTAIGLYLEHAFAYRTAPWAADVDALTPERIRRLTAAAQRAGVRIVPFLNTLGHMEGFIRAEGGQWLAEGPTGFGGAQICPSRPECAAFARGLVDDAIAAFDDQWLHLGGDETRQLGQCPACAERVGRIGKGGLYADHFGELCRYVVERGRRPCLWGDMLLQYPEALDALPRQTIIFDWQYFNGPQESTALFRGRGFDVVCCPSLQSYNSGWCFLGASQHNVDQHVAAADRLGALGVLLTSWEFAYFSQYSSVWPLIWAAGRRMVRGASWGDAITAEGGEAYARAADLLGNQVPAANAFLAPGSWRQLRDRLVMRLDPFALWRAWRAEGCGDAGDRVLVLCKAIEETGADSLTFPCQLHRVAVQWTRLAEQASLCYRDSNYAACAEALHNCAEALATLRPGLARASAECGSRADPARLDQLIDHTEAVAARLAAVSSGKYRPAFELLTARSYVGGERNGWIAAAHSL